MNVQKLSVAVAPHLPKQVQSAGVSVPQVQHACQAHAENAAAAHPYPEEMGKTEQRQWSRELAALSHNAQASFQEQTGATLRASQLVGALHSLEAEQSACAADANAEIGRLKKAYWGQVGKTAGWMGGTLACLAATGVLPNPVTAVASLVTGAMCVRSIGKARAAARQLGNEVPRLQASARSAAQLAAEAGASAPLVAAWAGLLESGQKVA